LSPYISSQIPLFFCYSIAEA